MELLSANPLFAFVRCPDGRETSASTRDLTPCPLLAEQDQRFENVSQQDTSIEQSSGSSHATVDRCENFTDTSLNGTEAVAVPGSSGKPSGSGKRASRPSREVPGLRRRRKPSDVGLTMNGLH